MPHKNLKEHRKYHREYGRRYYQNHADVREQQRERRLKRYFNLTIKEYDTLVSFQHGACAICSYRPGPGNKRLSGDHSHRTGLLRGALCMHCNKVLAWFQDNAERFRRAAEYLTLPPATVVFGQSRFCLPGRVLTSYARRKMLARKAIQSGLVPPNAYEGREK